MSNDYTDKQGYIWREPTPEDLKPGAPVREAVESVLDSWAPNHVSDGRVDSYEDWVERVEGSDWPGQSGVKISLGNDTGPGTVHGRIVNIAKAVAKEHR